MNPVIIGVIIILAAIDTLTVLNNVIFYYLVAVYNLIILLNKN